VSHSDSPTPNYRNKIATLFDSSSLISISNVGSPDNLAIMPSHRYHHPMTSPQLSVRSARARDLAHQLSALEKRPIHAIVEDALTEYAKRHPIESAEAFLKRLQANAVMGETDDLADLDAFINENRKPHFGIDL
jgi:hypothetical protein